MKLSKLVLPLSALVLLTGCAKEAVQIATAKPICPAIENICITKSDVLSEPTATTIEGNNLARAKLCGAPPPCGKKKG